MTKRRLLCWSLILLILAAFAVWLEPTRVVWGWLRGEAFYQGRPTSYWRDEVRRWKPIDFWGSPMELIRTCQREPTWFENLLSRFITLPERPWPSLLDGELAGKEVLQELRVSPELHVQIIADEGLRRFETGLRGPGVVWIWPTPAAE